MNIDIIKILDEQIWIMQAECDKLFEEIDDKSRNAIILYLADIASGKDGLVTDQYNARIKLETEINDVSARRSSLMRSITQFRNLKTKIEQGEFTTKIEEYINHIQEIRVDCQPV